MGVEFLLYAFQNNIDSGDWAPGMRLPAERELAKQYRVGRNTVRRILANLETQGLIVRHVGRGTFVAKVSQVGTNEDVDASIVNPEEVMEARLLIEPLLARLVVARASNVELEAIKTLVKRGSQARSMTEFEHWDNKLHRAIANASKNKYLIGIVEGMHRIRRSGEWGALRRRGLTDDRRRAYQQEHERIVDALYAREAEQAHQAIIDHLAHVRSNLLVD